ncbi:BT1 family protein [Leishmania donovani]|nr:BT1 family protein [Leishmania donovani]
MVTPVPYTSRTAFSMGSRESIPTPSSVPVSWRRSGALPADLGLARSRVSSGADQDNVQSCRSEPSHDSDEGDAGRASVDADHCKGDSPTATDATGLLHPNHQGLTRRLACPTIPRMVTLLLLFSSLVQGFSSSVISIFINRELALQPVEVTQYWMCIGCTMWCQPIVGYISDAVVVFSEKRRPLFVLAAVSNTVIYTVYSLFPGATSSFGRLVALSMVSQFCTMGLYIPLNGLVVELGWHDAETAEESNARMSAIVSKTMVWRSTGSLAGAVLHTCLIALLSVRPLLSIAGILFLVLVPIVLVTPRRLFLRSSTHDCSFCRHVAKACRMAWRRLDIRDPRSDGLCFIIVLAFVFVYTMMPDAGSVYYSYLYVVFDFPNWFYSINGCVDQLGSIAGAYVFSCWAGRRATQEARGGARMSLFFIFTIGSVAWAVGYATNLLLCTGFITETLGMSAAVYVPVDTFFTSLVARFAFMPTLVMAAEHAPKFFEATTFEVFSAASMGGSIVSGMLISSIAKGLHITRTDYSQLWALIVVSIVAKLAPIFLAYHLPERCSARGDEGRRDDAVVVAGDEGRDSTARANGATHLSARVL